MRHGLLVACVICELALWDRSLSTLVAEPETKVTISALTSSMMFMACDVTFLFFYLTQSLLEPWTG